MSETAEFQRALFTRQTGSDKTPIEVHFNPSSLQFSITNTLEKKGKGNKIKQFVSQSTGKLSMELLFDTSHSGDDVRAHTEKIAKFMEPDGKVPPIVKFEWGKYAFQGMVEQFRETIDFFAPNGVPLRSTVSLTMASQDKVFDTSGGGDAGLGTGGLGADGPVDVPASPAPERSPSAVAQQAGDPRGARAVAALNDEPSLRFSAGASLTVAGGAAVRAAAGLAGGVSSSLAKVPLDPSKLVSAANPTPVSTGAQADFELGGGGIVSGSAGMKADVSGGAGLQSLIQIEGG